MWLIGKYLVPIIANVYNSSGGGLVTEVAWCPKLAAVCFDDKAFRIHSYPPLCPTPSSQVFDPISAHGST